MISEKLVQRFQPGHNRISYLQIQYLAMLATGPCENVVAIFVQFTDTTMDSRAPSPSAEIPFQGKGLAFWREFFTEARKLRLDRAPTRIGALAAYLASGAQIARLYAGVNLWHGTGRYQYQADGKVRDVLQGMASQGGLIPHSDNWDIKRGTMRATCTALSRMYARLYASMHYPNGRRISNELGTRELWAYYFFVTSTLVAIAEYRLSARAILNRDLTALYPDVAEMTKRWTMKISSVELSQKDAFLIGTDIKANYPILVGIKEGAFIPARTSKFINLHERRAETPIKLTSLTHLEVPLDQVEPTRELLDRSGIDYVPVIPIEFGEEYCRSFSFRKLVSGGRLSQLPSAVRDDSTSAA